MSLYDFEIVLLLLLSIFLFLFGLVKKDTQETVRFSGIDLSMSIALKGIACVLILMGHFFNPKLAVESPTLFSSLVYSTTANIVPARSLRRW